GDGDPGSEAVTRAGAVIGTPAYMAPEQFRHETTDARSDQFSFCVALHEALVGTRPADTLALAGAAAAAPAAADHPELADEEADATFRTSIPGWLRGIVRRGSSMDREQRYRSMEELLAALERGRTQLQRRVSVVAASIAALLLCAGAWRLGYGNR